jgi:hypothetical protein
VKPKILLISLLVLFSFKPNDSFSRSTKAIWNKEVNALSIGGQTSTWHYRADRLNVNKKSEALIFLPDHSAPDDMTLIFWFHGCNGYSDRTFDTRLALQLKKLQEANRSYALVVPELLWSKNTKTTCSRQGRSFRKAGELVSFVNDSIGRINILLRASSREILVDPRVVFIGHSAGGSVFKAAALSGDLCKINPSVVVWSDSTYSRWFDYAWKNCLEKGDSDVVVLIRKWTKTWKSFKRSRRGKNTPDFLDVRYFGGKIYHSTIGDNAIEFADVFPDGC